MSKIKIIIFILVLGCFSTAFAAKKPAKKENLKQQILSSDEKTRFDYYFFEAMRQKNLEHYDAEMEALRMCESIDSLNGSVQSELGILYSNLDKTDKAVYAFQKAVNANPTNWWYRVQLISTLSSREKYEEAINQTLELKKQFPEKEEVYTMLASLYKQTGEYDKAIKALDDLEVFTGINDYLSFQKFQLYSALNKNQKAMAEIDKLIAKYPAETRYQVLKGDILLQLKQEEKAYQIYQNILATDPSNPFVYVSLANYYKQKNLPEKAMDAIVSALKNPQLPSDTKMEILGQYVEKLLYNKEKIAETENLFKILVDSYPLDEKTHMYYALFLQHQKRNDEALSELESVININPKNEQAWLNSLNILSEKEDTLGILNLTEKALKQLPETPQFYFYRSIAFYQLGKYDEALKTNEDALKSIDTSVPQVLSNFYAQMADIYYKMKEKEKAFDNYEKALNADPTNIYVMNNYAYYLSEEKTELRKAERMSAKTVEQEPTNSTYLDTYAWILYQQGNYSLAKFYIQKAVDNLDKEHEPGVILEHYGDILFALKDNAKALEMWQKAYDSGKKDDELKKKIEDLKKSL
ncbi:Tetratricopeptide TPR_1 repeat-containing protein [uncultured Paludibacter sp.]|uniref:Tetratricopeptide TPR_1 repeat-containing protein n=1 Tax=uncultured Paludibacter sp. TaxID=497635 RepID=A0A653AGV6_9BACT|nr:Tetratricopeptide TPR_1 repeat-containing protein [uncultured Paludibacter sp.]